ncbi:MAG: hypothetical protein HY072_00025 [Deltaproteobacteria bacterium]|nr:hypothetical protein [Deltaproteobacteria bacterium]
MNTATCPLAHCWGYCVLSCIAWWLIASALLYFTWNKVIAYIVSLKKVRFWQALLFVAMLCVFCAPRYYLAHKTWHGQKCSDSSGKTPCPYENSNNTKESK